ncbi:MAG: hypothetical protein K6G90_01655 [Clostridia bacterium]|nr:hypothetical protein [Clostridia bacterium]
MEKTVKITPEIINEKPVSPLLCGNFIELGYGLQTEAMWGEMLFNRSFEIFPPYKQISKMWFDLLYKDDKGEEQYETDWRKFDWYHSGYEHNAWFAAPNDVETFEIRDDSVFITETTPYSRATIRQVPGGVHGRHCMRVENPSGAPGGMGQRGKVLKAGEEYRFSGYFRNADEADVSVTVALHRDGDFTAPLEKATFILTAGDTEFGEYSHTFRPDADCRAMLCVWIENGAIECDCFSLMPSHTCGGWRTDVIEKAKEVAPRVIRWPGGCFASFYDWRDGVGPRNGRDPSESYFWGGFQYNDVGSLEMAEFCEAVGAQQMICVNMFHPDKKDYLYDDCGRRFPEFTDIEEGARLAADWVAYMNADTSHPMGRLRASHGREKPFGVRFWEIDNETCRWFNAKTYAQAVKVYARAMKAVDPTIKIGLTTYAIGGSDDIRGMLEITGEYVDFFADRGPEENNLRQKLSIIREYNRQHGSDIGYCNTEWLPYDMFCFNVDAFNWTDGNKSFMFSKWRYAMNTFRQLMMWQRQGGDVWFVNFNNFANTHAQNVLDSPKEGAFITACGRALSLMSRSPAARVLKTDGYEPKLLDTVQAQASWDRDRTRLVLYLYNLEDGRQTLTFDYSALGVSLKEGTAQTVFADDLYDMNTQSDPDRIRSMSVNVAPDNENKTVTLTAPRYSFTIAVLSAD